MTDESLRIDFVIERLDDLRIAADMEGKQGIGMIFTAPDAHGGEPIRFGLSVEAVRTLHRALVEVMPPPNPVLPRH